MHIQIDLKYSYIWPIRYASINISKYLKGTNYKLSFQKGVKVWT